MELTAYIKDLCKKGESTELRAALTELKEILSEAISFPEPNFFAMGYYMTFSKEPLPALPVLPPFLTIGQGQR